MRNILVTGANKGIGRAIVQSILEGHSDTHVLLGSRDRARGDEAKAALSAQDGTWASRITVIPLDVASDTSTTEARDAVRARLAGQTLHGLVNNAGINVGAGHSLAHILDVNVGGVHRVSEAFIPLLDPAAGRIVNVTSAAGPSFVATCSPEKRAFFLDATMTWARLRAFMDRCIAITDGANAGERFTAEGLGDGAPYGLSKACANALTLALAHEHPGLRVNACTPGFIETDMTRGFLRPGQSAAEVGMKTPADGAKAPLHLLFDPLDGNARYYGSDAQRSPLDRYRAPGSEPYTGA